jgi:peptidoglycan/LPS O-acetylase OafA/YrhL
MPGLDALRGLAIVLVLFHNLSFAEHVHSPLFKLWNVLPESGWIGVQIFFVLSGFLITGILVDDRGIPRFYGRFYIRRALRIFPLYYALLIVYAVLYASRVLQFRIAPLTAISYATYLQNWSALFLREIPPGFGPLWSLAVEEQFYLLWPLLIGKVSLRASAIACVAIIVASFLGRMGMHLANMPPGWLYVSTPARADALAIGALLALLLRSPTWRPRLIGALPWVGAVSALALGALALSTHGLNRLNPWMQVYGYTLVAVLAAVVTARAALAGLRAPVRPRTRILTGVLTFFGKYSYGIYVVHMPIKIAAMALLGAALRRQSTLHPLPVDVLFVAAGTAASVALALVSWRLIERPFLSLKDRFAGTVTRPTYP